MVNALLIGVVAAVVIIAVIAGVFLYHVGSNSKSAGSNSNTNTGSGPSVTNSNASGNIGSLGSGSTSGGSQSASSTISSSNSGSGTSGTFSGYQSTACGSGNSCISEAEAVSMLGSGGSYISGYIPDFHAASKIAAASGGNYSDYVYTNNVTSIYTTVYNFTFNQSNPTLLKSLIEIVFVSPHPQALYKYNLNQSFGGWTSVNATMNGLTYSYLGLNSQYGSSSQLIGWKGSEMVTVIISGENVSQSTLASTVSQDMP